MKDLFSQQAEAYAVYRPSYPKALPGFLLGLVPGRDAAWDCGTGNGQMANILAPSFKNVYATDISAAQLDNATRRSNIHYSRQPAEATDFPENSFDLITVAQAIHWFNFDAFYAEVLRTARPDAILAVTGYGFLSVTPEVNSIVQHFYDEITAPYWEPERKYVEERYRTIPFPFKEIEAPHLQVKYEWTLDQLLGYLGTWSAVQKYKKVNGTDPVELVSEDLYKAWDDAYTHSVTFPILLRVGRIKK